MLDSISTHTLLLLLLGLIVLSGFFSSAETGMMALNRYRLRHLVRKNHRRAAMVLALLKKPDKLLSVILIGNTFSNILASSIATLLCMKVWGEVGMLFATVGLTIVILIFAEIAPKTLAALYPQRIAFFAVWPLRVLLTLLLPFIWVVSSIANALLRCFGVKVTQAKSDALSYEELRSIVRESNGRIASDHLNMLLGILDLDLITVEDIMIPRSDIVSIDLADEWDDILYQLTHSQHNRLLVYDENLETIKGVLHLRVALNHFTQEKLDKSVLTDILEKPYFIPETTSLNQQLVAFRETKRRVALVVDEYGELQGLVTLEDLLEEIVGEFTTDVADSSREVHEQADGSYLVDASVTLRDLNRIQGWTFPLKGPKTLSGLIVEYLETIPTAGTGLRLAGYPMEIVKVQDNAIKTVRVYKEKS